MYPHIIICHGHAPIVGVFLPSRAHRGQIPRLIQSNLNQLTATGADVRVLPWRPGRRPFKAYASTAVIHHGADGRERPCHFLLPDQTAHYRGSVSATVKSGSFDTPGLIGLRSDFPFFLCLLPPPPPHTPTHTLSLGFCLSATVCLPPSLSLSPPPPPALFRVLSVFGWLFASVCLCLPLSLSASVSLSVCPFASVFFFFCQSLSSASVILISVFFRLFASQPDSPVLVDWLALTKVSLSLIPHRRTKFFFSPSLCVSVSICLCLYLSVSVSVCLSLCESGNFSHTPLLRLAFSRAARDSAISDHSTSFSHTHLQP